MKRLVRRTAQMERNAARRLARQTEKEQKAETWKARAEQKRAMNYIRTETREARRARREAWELGAIAPMRDHLFRSSSIGLHHGAIHVSRYQYEFEPSKEAKDEHCAWAGGSKHLCLAVKDRVVVVEGSHKGKIGPISAIDEKFGLLQIETVATVNINIDDELLGPEGVGFAPTPVMAAAEWLPVSAVRLVHPVTDYATNTTRDVIIKQLIPVNKYLDRPTGKREWDRLVPGLNITIPWPRKEDPKHEDHPSDTLRIDAEAKTFVPTLLRPPMPVAVLDELRGKYSRFRTRHTDEYVAQKEADEALKERRKSKAGVHPSMMTPLQELNRRLRADSKALGQPELGDEMLERIGRVIARNIGMYEEGEAAERQRAVARREREEAERRREIVERHRRNSEPAMGDLQIAEAIREPRDPAAPS